MASECVAGALRRIVRILRDSGVDTPERDARLLIAAAIGSAPTALILEPDRVLKPDEAAQLNIYIERRSSREPVSRILGTREFYGRPFIISPATLDPRPCSETLIEATLDVADEMGWRGMPISIIDIGTGSGCLAVTLACELPHSRITATDVCASAIDIATENAVAIGVADRVTFLQRRSLQDVGGPFDILVSNPPYIPSADIAGLEAEVRDFEPRGALDGGTDGLDIYRELAKGLGKTIPSGWCVFEVGAGQARDVERILTGVSPNRHSAHCRFWADLGGHTRCVAMQTQS